MNQSLNGSSYARSMNGLNSITADNIDTGTIVTTELDCVTLDVTGLSTLNNLNVTGYENVSGDLSCYSNIIIDTPGKYLEFPDGTKQTTAAIAQGLGVVRGYLNGFSTQDQLNISTSAYNTMTFNMVDSHNQIDISGNSKIVFQKTAAYLIIISVQVKKDDAGDDDVYFWLAKNGVDIADSNTLSTLSKNNDVDLVTINYGGNFVAGDYIEWRWFSADANLYLHHDIAQTINGVALPATPSVILSVEETNSNYNSLQDLDVSGNVTITGNLDVSGNITGNWNITDLHLTGNLTVDGSTNFVNRAPRTAIAPTNANDLTNKTYVDAQSGAAVSSLLAGNNTWTGINTHNSELTVIGATSDCKFRVETYVDTNIKNNYSDINLDSINLNVTGTINSQSINCTNINADAIQATSVNSGTGNFSDDSGTTALINALQITNGTTYTDYNPLSGDVTLGWTYILFSSSGTLAYKGTSTTTKMYYVSIGAGGSSSGSNQGIIFSTDGGSAAGAMSGEFKDGSFNSVPNTAITITLGAAGNAGTGGYNNGAMFIAATGASAGTNTTITGSMLTSTAKCGDRQPAPPTSNYSYGQDASGAFFSTIGGGTYYGYGNQSGISSTTRPTSGTFDSLMGTNRCIGGGGCWANQSGYITNYYTSGGTVRIDLYDGRYYYVYAGSSLATVNAEVSTPTGIYKWGRGGDGPSGKFKASGGRNGAKGGPSCFMVYFQTSTTTSVPGYALSTKGFFNSGITMPNFDSGWFNAAAVNTLYTFTHNLNISLSYPPRVRILVSAVNNPVLGTNNVYEAQISQSAGNLGNPTNTGWGLNWFISSANAIKVSTGNSGIYIDNGGTGVSITTGYIRVYIYL